MTNLMIIPAIINRSMIACCEMGMPVLVTSLGFETFPTRYIEYHFDEVIHCADVAKFIITLPSNTKLGYCFDDHQWVWVQ